MEEVLFRYRWINKDPFTADCGVPQPWEYSDDPKRKEEVEYYINLGKWYELQNLTIIPYVPK